MADEQITHGSGSRLCALDLLSFLIGNLAELGEIVTFCSVPGGKHADKLPIADVPYYQMWARRHTTFQPHLSILDLLMNEGREGIFTLLRMVKGNINS